MSEQNAIAEFRRSFKVGKFTITMCIPMVAGKPVGMQTEWAPYYPGGLNGQLFRKYRRQRDACLAALAEQLGGAIVSIDEAGATAIGPDGSKKTIAGEGAK